MSYRPLLRALALSAAFVALLSLPTLVLAQATGGGATFIAMPDAFPDIDARAILLRERGQDIVVLRVDDATPETLAMSLALLDRMRVRHPSPKQGQMIPITGYAITSPPWGSQLSKITDTLLRLERAPTRPVGNLGPGRFVRYRGH